MLGLFESILYLKISTLCIKEDLNWLESDQDLTHGQLTSRLQETSRTLEREFSTILCLIIPSEKQKFYDEPALFGEDVSMKFPSALFDIDEAGKCLATD